MFQKVMAQSFQKHKCWQIIKSRTIVNPNIFRHVIVKLLKCKNIENLKSSQRKKSILSAALKNKTNI